MKFLKLALILLGLSSCTHTINFRSSHFLTPTVSDHQLGGSISFSEAGLSKLTIIDDISTNPPLANRVRLNDDVTTSDFVLFEKMGFDLNLSVIDSLEVFTTGPVFGLKWQFFNFADYNQIFVASVMAGLGGKKTESEKGSDKASSKVGTVRYGASFGYAESRSFIPYISYIHEDHKVKTEVDNSYGHFDGYSNQGKHDYFSVGISSFLGIFKLAAEYNYILLDWEASDYKKQNTVGILIGSTW